MRLNSELKQLYKEKIIHVSHRNKSRFDSIVEKKENHSPFFKNKINVLMYFILKGYLIEKRKSKELNHYSFEERIETFVEESLREYKVINLLELLSKDQYRDYLFLMVLDLYPEGDPISNVDFFKDVLEYLLALGMDHMEMLKTYRDENTYDLLLNDLEEYSSVNDDLEEDEEDW